MSEKKFVVTPPKPKPSALTRGTSQIKYGVKNVGEGIAKKVVGTIKKAFPIDKPKYRKPQNIEVPESMESVFMKAVRPMFKANLQKIKKEHTSGVPTFKSVREAQRKSAIAKTQSQIKKDSSLNKMMKKLRKQKNID